MNFLDKVLLRLKYSIWARIKSNYYPSFNLSHSLYGEDMIVRFLAESQKINKGFYVDIGAHHPINASNTYHFYCKGWRGINIDATPNSMEIFNILRPRDINLEVCISSEEDTNVDFFVFEQGLCNTFDQEMADKALSLGYTLIEKRALKTSTLKEILDAHLPRETSIDLMNIDIEGMDESVLMSNNWDIYKPKILIIEKQNLVLSEIHNLLIVKYLTEQGYVPIGASGVSLILQLKPNN